MFVRRFFESSLAQSSYLIGCPSAGQAIVIDPVRDPEPYLQAAEDEGVRITHVTETHIHADFVSGSLELAARTGARICVSGEGGDGWHYAFADRPDVVILRDGDRIDIGRVRIDVVHTPGHTPEHLTFLVTDTAAADEPIAAATGDFLFVGDVGRPDLLERAVHMEGTMRAGARTLYASLQRFAARPDWLQIWPGHGAGSACGKGISAIPSSTLGYERRFNWAFQVHSEAEFVDQVLEGQPDPPLYFAQMKRVNQAGPRVLGALPHPLALEGASLAELAGADWPVPASPVATPSHDDLVRERRALLVDTRPPADFATGSVPGSLNLPATATFATWAGWLLPYDRPIRLIVSGAGVAAERHAADLARTLALIGLDHVDGYVDEPALDAWLAAGHARQSVPQIGAADLAESLRHGGVTLVDVRHDQEFAAGHIHGARHVPLGHLSSRLAELPTNRPVVVQCQSGGRSAIAASLLRARGVQVVLNFAGGLSAWVRAGMPVET